MANDAQQSDSDSEQGYTLNLERVFRFDGLRRDILIQEEWMNEDCDLGGSVWSSSVRLSQYLIDHAQTLAIRDSNVLELGAGCHGICGIVSYFLGARQVVLTDQQSLTPYINENIVKNAISLDSVTACALDWKNPSQLPCSKFDLILAAECLYNLESVPLLCSVLKKYSRPETRIALCGIIGPEVFDAFDDLFRREFQLISLHDEVSNQIQCIDPLRQVYVFSPRQK
ncbi:hypothetical protein MIR68_008155 [Amoeboaphelidium protococcarum]|nr:hypothetical protein MIR68_008155 [Amoeboaphelidium protococcarum]